MNGGEPYNPLPWQERHIHASSGKYRTVALACGRRAGKTDGLIPEVVRECFKSPKTVWGKTQYPVIYICGPTNELAQRIWTPIWNLFVPDDKGDYQPPLGDFHQEHDKNRGYIKLINGTEIFRKSGDDPRSAQGQRVTAAFVDEAQDMNEEFWANLIPALSDAPGTLWCIGIARGKGRFRSYWMAGQEGDPAYYSASVPSEANPILKDTASKLGFPTVADYLEHDFGRSMTENEKRQHFMAEWVEEDGQVFKNFEKSFTGEWEEPKLLTIDAGTDKEHVIPAVPYIMSLDVAQTIDYTVAYIGDVSRETLVARERFQGVDYMVQGERLANLYRKYHCKFIVMDSTGVGKGLADILRSLGCSVIEFVLGAKSKSELINTFAAEVERGHVTFPKGDSVLLAEMKMYEATVNGNGVRYSAPPGYHDDCLREGTLVKTEFGYRPIESIQRGDLVYTHTGRLCTVEQVVAKPFASTMHRMKFGGQVPLDLSYNHPLLAAKRDYSSGKEFTRRDWEFPGDWKKSYRSVTPLIHQSAAGGVLIESDFYSNPPYGHPLLRSWNLDAEAADLLGRFLADGHASNRNYILNIAFHEKERGEAERYSRYLEGLGVSSRIEEPGGKALTLVWASKLMWHALNDCYDTDREKRMPSWGYRLGVHLPLVLDGWLDGDGWRRKPRPDGGKGHTIGCTTSRALALEMRDIAISAGRSATIAMKKRHRYGKPSKDQWWVSVYDQWLPLGMLRRVSEGEVVAPLSSHETYEFEGEVYNLQVAEDRSFIAEGIAVHNCIIAAALCVQKMARNRSMAVSPVAAPYITWGHKKKKVRRFA